MGWGVGTMEWQMWIVVGVADIDGMELGMWRNF